MATFTYGQLEQLWQEAGGSARLAPVMAAIALAESGGRSGATHKDSNGSTDYGLWQINSIHGYNPSQLTGNPVYNAKAAVAIEQGSGLGAWSTYNNGSYKKYLGGGVSGLPYNPNDSKVGRIDQGVDITSSSPFVAVAPGRVVHIDPNFYNGTPAVYIKLDQPVTVNGHKYTGMYYAETRSLVKVGQHVTAGQAVSGPGSAEIGFAKKFGSSTSSWLPAAHGTYTEGKATTAGADFASTIKPKGGGGSSFWGDVGSVASAPFTVPYNAAASVVSGAGTVVSDAGAVTSFLGKLTSPEFWLRGLQVIGGGILLILGLYLLAKQVGLGADVPAPVSAAAGAIPQVREARAAKELTSAHRAGQLQAARREGRKSVASQGNVARGRTRRVGTDEVAARRQRVRERAARSSNPETNDIPF